MSTWSDGYFTDSHYTFGYFSALSPVQQRFALLLNGWSSPPEDDAPAHCELGFGQGVSMNVHAASNPGEYVGTDFSAAQVAYTRQLARQSGNTHVRALDDSFAALAERSDLPAFNSISLHGIWSWVSADNQRWIMDVIGRHIKPGGVVYISYNCMPGWAQVAPLQKLLWLADQHHQQGDDAHARIARAIAFARDIFATHPAYAQSVDTALRAHMEMLRENPTYLAHEYLNTHWHAPYFADVAQTLAGIRLDFACASDALRQLEALYLTADQRAFLNAVPAPALREQLFDYCANTRFRADLFVRGARRLSPEAQRLQLAEQEIVLCVEPDLVEFSVQTHLGEFTPNADQYDCVRDALTADAGRPKRLGDILDHAARHNLAAPRAMRAVVTLVGKGRVMACQPAQAQRAVASRCRRFNQAVCAQAVEDEPLSVLASPVTGAGLGGITRTERLFTLAHLRGQDAIALASAGLQRAGATLQDENGKPVTDPAQVQMQLQRQYQAYQASALPLLSVLGIV